MAACRVALRLRQPTLPCRRLPLRRLTCLAASSSLRIDVGAAGLPHPRKKTQGEDAYTTATTASSVLLGVADGVSSSNDGGRYAHALMDAVRDSFLCNKDGESLIHPSDMLTEAWQACKLVEGRSTACLVTLDLLPPQPRIRTANMGDSAMWLLRRRADRGGRLGIALKSIPQV